jgi:hypothetical protein
MIENNRFPVVWRVGLRSDLMCCGHNANYYIYPIHR